MAETARRVHVTDLPNPGDEAWHVLIDGNAGIVNEPSFRTRWMTIAEGRRTLDDIIGAGVDPDYWALTWGPVPGTYRTRARRRFRRRPRTVQQWESLSEPYRRRLLGAGITRYRYLRGDSLLRARGRPRPLPVNTPQARALADPLRYEDQLDRLFPRAWAWLFVRTLEGH